MSNNKELPDSYKVGGRPEMEWVEPNLAPLDNDAIEIMQSFNTQPNIWVDVKDRLPDKSGEVLIFTEAHSIFVSHYSKPKKLFTVYGINSVEITDIKTTHWMPLPTPPNNNQSK